MSFNGKLLTWRTRKTEELMAFLISYGKDGVSKDLCMDRLWQEMNTQKASKNFEMKSRR